MAHIPVRHPAGDLRSCKSAILLICHRLFLDGVYVDRLDGSVRFRWVSSPTSQELTQLAQTIAHRVSRFLERQGLLERDADDCMDAARDAAFRSDAPGSDHLSHRVGPPGRAQSVRLKRLLLVHCGRCRPVIQRNNTATRLARYPVSPCMQG